MSPTYSELPGLLARDRLDDDERIIAAGREQFDVSYYRARGDLVRALAVVGKRRAEHRTDLVALLRSGLQAALWRGEKREGGQPGLDANFIGVSAAAIALAALDAREAVSDLLAAFAAVSDDAVHYELNQCAGAIAVALTILKSDSSAAIAPVLDDYRRKWEARHAFVNQLRYAMWVMRRDAVGAQTWLDAESEGCLYASAALADMKATSSLPAVLGLDVWHDNEPAAEFPHIYAVTFTG